MIYFNFEGMSNRLSSETPPPEIYGESVVRSRTFEVSE